PEMQHNSWRTTSMTDCNIPEQTSECPMPTTDAACQLETAAVAVKPLRRFELDAEFRTLLEPLTADEHAALEQNLLQARSGLDPLRVWQEGNVLLDGYHRLDLCEQHGLPYETEPISLPDRATAWKWVIDQQLGRRNLTSLRASYLRGLEYAQTKQTHG